MEMVYVKEEIVRVLRFKGYGGVLLSGTKEGRSVISRSCVWGGA